MKIRLIACITVLGLSVFVTSPISIASEPSEQVKASLQNYTKAWNEDNEAERTKLLESAWTENAIYSDPSAHVVGRSALVKHIGEFRSNPQMKGAKLAFGSDIDIHHNVFRFQWIMKDGSGNTVIAGMDYGEFDDDGTITKIVGFFGPFSNGTSTD